MKLTVEKFSCLDYTNIEISRFNVLIGPQASGKSVLSKLIYFFYTIKDLQIEQLQLENNIESFSTALKEKFILWFPITAWGESKFKITYECHKFKVTISRVIYKGELGENLRITFSDGIKKIHEDLLESSIKINQQISEVDEFFLQYKYQQRINQEVQKRYANLFNEGYIDHITYIPAGRSFFTNLGRALMAFEKANMLDPVTVEFGRLYSNFIQGNKRLLSFIKNDTTSMFLSEIIGGEILYEKNEYYLKSKDERIIPFNALSSGQQEILPLLLTFGLTGKDKNISSLLFVEEPEAHLFPQAQSKIIEGLTSYINDSKNRSIFITTHSPYVLSKINNQIKAGIIEKSTKEKDKLLKLEQIIQKNHRIDSRFINAYCIENGQVKDIIDPETGLINAEYLDEISNQIGNQFEDLLDLQYS
ncbi:AAA family ATPase [Comamonas thiooxydans]|nr:ATP-binding protein [Comamonas thiooxydans]